MSLFWAIVGEEDEKIMSKNITDKRINEILAEIDELITFGPLLGSTLPMSEKIEKTLRRAERLIKDYIK